MPLENVFYKFNANWSSVVIILLMELHGCYIFTIDVCLGSFHKVFVPMNIASFVCMCI
jgi:hypothetical protein